MNDITTITYVLNSGVQHGENLTSYTVESSTIELKDPTKEGYYFAGWFEESTLSTMKTSIPAGSHDHLTVHAAWNKAYVLQETGPEGGTIFYDRIDYDYRTDDWHYAECGNFDIGDFEWMETAYEEPYINVVGTSESMGTGKENSELILIAGTLATNRNSAANACHCYDGAGSGEIWFLPSKDELVKMYENLMDKGVGHFNRTSYWSSSQVSLTEAWSIDFSDGSANESNKGNTYVVRPIRRF